MRLPKHANKEGEPLLDMGTNPQTPGIYRFPAGMFCRRAALPPNHASPCVGALVVSQRCHIFRPGSVSLPHVSLIGNLGSKYSLPEHPPARYNYLVLAVSIGRF
jgi:hypothetical protein